MQKGKQNVSSQSCLLSYQNASDSNPKPVLKRSVTKKKLTSDENEKLKKLESLASKAIFTSSQLSDSIKTNKLDHKS